MTQGKFLPAFMSTLVVIIISCKLPSADKVLTDVNNAMTANLKNDFEAKVKRGEFKSQAEADSYVQAKLKANVTGLDKIAANVVNQMQKNILEKFGKTKMTEAQVYAVEADANIRASKKLGGNVQYLNGQNPVEFKGKVLPSKVSTINYSYENDICYFPIGNYIKLYIKATRE